MTVPRKKSSDLGKLFQASISPAYLLDDRRGIVYCNAACARWCEIEPDQLLGQVCEYRSDRSDRAQLVAALLCPPPEALAGALRNGEIAARAADGAIRRRRAEFVPLEQSDGGIQLLVVAATHDLQTDDDATALATTALREQTSAELHARLQQLNRDWQAAHQSSRIYGDSPTMRRVRALVDVAAGCRASVLIVGPAGSGRQHVAKAIHCGRGGQPTGNLLPLACGLLDGEVLRAQLAPLTQKRSSGNELHTLLLTEVDRLPGELFPELLHLLRSESPRLRIVSTASQSLVGQIAGDEMPAELAAGLSTLQIEMSPLTARLDDLPLLAQAFIERLNGQGDKQLAGVAPEALDRLAAYPWPGNVAELIEILGVAFDRAEGPMIVSADLPERVAHGISAAHRPRRDDQPIVLDEFLAEVENELIRRALARSKGNKAKAARLLGLTRPRLYRRMIQLGLASPTDVPEFTPMPDDEES